MTQNQVQPDEVSIDPAPNLFTESFSMTEVRQENEEIRTQRTQSLAMVKESAAEELVPDYQVVDPSPHLISQSIEMVETNVKASKKSIEEEIVEQKKPKADDDHENEAPTARTLQTEPNQRLDTV